VIENESQQAALAEPRSAREDVREDAPERQPADPAQGDQTGALTGSEVIKALVELGPVVGLLAIVSVTLPGILGSVVLFGSVFGPEGLKRWVDSLGSGAVPALIFASLFALATGSMILPTYALSFASGVFFGGWTGGLVAMFGVTGGAMIGYLWGMGLARGRVMAVIDRHERASVVRAALIDRDIWSEIGMVMLLRFPPSSPFALTNLAMSATRVRPVAYMTGTIIGIAPRTLFAVWLGVQVQDLTQASSAGGATRTVIALAVGIVVFVIAYRICARWAREALDRQTSDHLRETV
jgi:uncharacterized membrane protein YdjX (TVP38/TMEM64 family)